jgi:hypothetical protein
MVSMQCVARSRLLNSDLLSSGLDALARISTPLISLKIHEIALPPVVAAAGLGDDVPLACLVLALPLT